MSTTEFGLQLYSDLTEEPTRAGIYPYLDEEEPTFEWKLTREEALWEAQEMSRLGSHEAEGVWLLVAQGLPMGGE